MNRSVELTPIKAATAVLLCCVSALVTGCTSSQFLSVADNSPILAAAMRGKVHGGQQPITGASVQLWAVGASGYGSAATTLGSSVASDSNGNFSLGAYTCPTPSTLTYITASGGNPGLASPNPNIMLAAALGPCSSLTPSTFIFMDEVTTAATAYALGQYFTPAVGGSSSADSFGAPNTTQAQTGITNAFGTVNNLVCGVTTNAVCGNIATGNAVTSATLTATAGTVTATPESAKLNTVADILAACVNSIGVTDPSGTCTTLFNSVVTTSGAKPTDTLQAAVYMSLNPTSNNAAGSSTNLAALYGLVTGTVPYVGVSTQPTDWTVGIQYQGSGNTLILSSPFAMAADASGNIWIVDESTKSGFALASLTELSPTGNPLLASTLQVGGTGPTLTSNNPRNIAIDTLGNVFIPTSTSNANLFEYTNTGSLVVSPTLSKATYGIAIDGNNNVFVSEESSTPHFSFFEFVGGILTADHQVEYANYPTATPFFQAEQLAIDTSGNVWASPQGSASTSQGVLELSNINYATTCGAPPFTAAPCPLPASSSSANTYTLTTSAGLASAWGMAASPSGVWVANSTNSTLVNLTGTAPSISATAYGTGALTTPGYVAVDGGGNVWVTNDVATPGFLTEFNSSGTVLSPTGGFVHAGLGASSTSLQAAGITIDPSGNVWAADYATAGPTAFSVFEMVGAAAPTVTPIALALKNGTVGVKP